MNINAGIVDQHVRKIVDTHGSLLAGRGRDTEERRRSNAFCELRCDSWQASVCPVNSRTVCDCIAGGACPKQTPFNARSIPARKWAVTHAFAGCLRGGIDRSVSSGSRVAAALRWAAPRNFGVVIRTAGAVR